MKSLGELFYGRMAKPKFGCSTCFMTVALGEIRIWADTRDDEGTRATSLPRRAYRH